MKDKFVTDASGRDRVDRLIYYFGDVVNAKTKNKMRKKLYIANKKAAEKDKDERRIRNEVIKLHRQIKKDKDRRHTPRHLRISNE